MTEAKITPGSIAFIVGTPVIVAYAITADQIFKFAGKLKRGDRVTVLSYSLYQDSYVVLSSLGVIRVMVQYLSTKSISAIKYFCALES